MALALHAGEQREEEVLPPVPLLVLAPRRSSSGCLRRSPRLSGVQSDGKRTDGPGVPGVESRRQSPRLLPSPEGNVEGKEEKPKSSGARQRRLLLLCSPEMRRRSPRLRKDGENGSGLVALSDSSEKKACEMIRRRLGGSDLGVSSQDSLISRRTQHPPKEEEEEKQKRNTKLDSSSLEQSKNSGVRQRGLLLLASPEMRRRSPRLKEGENGSGLLALSDSSEKKACEMIRRSLGGFDLGVLSQTSLRSRRLPHPNAPKEELEKKRKRKLDSGGNSDKSPARKKDRSCVEDKGSANSASTGRLDQLWLSSCSSGFENGNENCNVPCSAEEENSTENGISLAGWNWSKISEGKILRRSPRSLSTATLSEAAGVNAPATKPKKKEQPSKNRSKDYVSCGAEEYKHEEVEEEKEHEEENVEQYKRCFFIGEPFSDAEAHQRWPWRYEMESTRIKGRSLTVNADEEDELVLNVQCHYAQAQINECVFELGDCAYMRGENGQKHIGRIIEFFQTTDEEDYCRVQWFYKAEDTVMKGQTSFHDEKRLFYSTIMNDNLLDCVISKLKIVQVTKKLNLKSNPFSAYDYYYDMKYCLDYSTFRTMPTEGHDLSSPCYNSAIVSISSTCLSKEDIQICELYNGELSLLDLYSGCGAMSTGLCLGAKMSGVDLVTRWAVDFDSHACESLRMNHPKTHVRNENAEDFLELLKQWEVLCKRYVDDNGNRRQLSMRNSTRADNMGDNSISDDEEFEVERLLDISYGDPDESDKKGLKFKVRWKGYDSDEDTWEPIEGLRNCQEHIRDFVTNGFKTKILPLPGDADVICGGPPCQGISGYNRFRSVDDPFDDDRNRQLVVFMDIVKFLKPKYILMENVMDILRFDKGSLGRYALSRLVHMNYQARVGIMAAGCYGLPQFRLRVFFWGAHPTEDLPQFPLPTHDVILRYWPPPEFERNVVAYDEGQSQNLQEAVLLCDALSDLPAVGNDGCADEMPYGKPPETEFQKYIRSTKCEEALLYDHRPFPLHEDDYIRVCHIPRRKGANFRDLPGIVVGDDNVVRRDPTCDNAILPSGKPMVPDYALTFEQGKSKRQFYTRSKIEFSQYASVQGYKDSPIITDSLGQLRRDTSKLEMQFPFLLQKP